MEAIKAPYTVTIEITEDADGWHLPTSEEYERRMKRREYIADFTQGKHGENVMPKQELIRCKDCARNDNCFMYRESGNDYGFCAWAYRRKE